MEKVLQELEEGALAKIRVDSLRATLKKRTELENVEPW